MPTGDSIDMLLDPGCNRFRKECPIRQYFLFRIFALSSNNLSGAQASSLLSLTQFPHTHQGETSLVHYLFDLHVST